MERREISTWLNMRSSLSKIEESVFNMGRMPNKNLPK
jgi:hypothetical protein